MKGTGRKGLSLILLLLFLLVLSALVSLSAGPAGIPVSQVVALFAGGEVSQTCRDVVLKLRLPRLLLGLSVGGALSLAGVVLQGMFRNPLVEPYTLGISGGAALGVCLNLVFRLNMSLGVLSVPLFGFAGALVVVGLVYFLSLRRGILRLQGLLLSGVMISFICSSLFMLITAMARVEDLHGIVFWTMGNLEPLSSGLTAIMIVVSLSGLLLSYLFCRELNAFCLGEEAARHLGMRTGLVRKILFLLAAVLTGASVAVAGIIGFVGLVVPHFMRMATGFDHRLLLITSFLAGGIFLITSDTLARTIISPLELPVGVITGIIGGTIFIAALYRKNNLRSME